jgi:antitoxin MazE
MKSAIRKMGNSHGVIIPKPVLAEVGAKEGDQVEVTVAKGKIIAAQAETTRALGRGQQASSRRR